MRTLILAGLGFFLGLVVIVLIQRPAYAPVNENASNLNAAGSRPNTNQSTVVAFDEIRTSTFVASIPGNNERLSASPKTVNLGFSGPLNPSSTVSVVDQSNQPVHLGAGTFSDDRQTLTVMLKDNLRGPLTVTYSACLPGGTCENGRFGFSVSPSL